MDETAALEYCGSLVRRAVACGTTTAEAYARFISRFQARVTRTGVQTEDAAPVGELALRVWRGNHMALATSTWSRDLQPAALVETAIRMADEVGVPSGAALPGSHPDSSIRRLAPPDQVSETQKVALARRAFDLASQALERPVDGVQYNEQRSLICLANSLGLASSYWKTRCSLSTWARDGKRDLNATVGGRNLEALQPKALAGRLADQAGVREPRPCPEGAWPVMMEAPVGAELARCLGHLFIYESIERGLPLWLKRMGTRVAGPTVTLVDDARREEGANTQPIDDEGVPSQRTVLIRAGVLTAWLHDCDSAARFHVQPNGKARRQSYQHLPRARPTNIYLEPSPSGTASSRVELPRGVVASTCVQPASVSPFTGQFLVVVDGWWVEQQERAWPIANIQLSGNLFRLLSSLVVVGSDLAFEDLSGCGSPTLYVGEMQVSGTR